MKFILAGVIIIFSLYKIFQPKLVILASDKYACIFGLFAGILGGAYNTNGPPIVIYGTLRRWKPEKFRATLQGYFLPTGAMIALGHCLGSFWTKIVLLNYFIALPIIFVATFAGGRLNCKIPKGKFDKYVYLCLVVLGIFLLIDTIR